VITGLFFLINWTNDILVWMNGTIGLPWGWCIIALTFLIRAAILPLSVKQIRSMREMSALQPHLKEIQERYKDDRERLQREMMGLYKEHGVNPLASCFPLLLQLPFFIAILYTLRSQTFQNEVGNAGWWFIKELTAKAHGSELIILVVLYVGTQLVAGLIMSSSAAGSQRWITLGLPLVFAPIIIGFPAGVVLYWITSNVWTMGQQAVIKVFFPAPDNKGKAPTPDEIAAGAPAAAAMPTKAPPPPPRKKKRRR
jgi:YidC/Oxa1 family membrane protein insertase